MDKVRPCPNLVRKAKMLKETIQEQLREALKNSPLKRAASFY